jgi:hypothetical protein
MDPVDSINFTLQAIPMVSLSSPRAALTVEVSDASLSQKETLLLMSKILAAGWTTSLAGRM